MRHLRLTRPEGTGQRWEISGLDDSFPNRLRGATEASLVDSIPIHPRQICHGSQVPLTVFKTVCGAAIPRLYGCRGGEPTVRSQGEHFDRQT